MKTFTFKTVAAASGVVMLASLTVLPAFADTSKVDYSNLTNFESTKSREQVRQEYFDAMKDGSLAVAPDSDAPVLSKSVPSNIFRQDVVAETIEWLKTKGTSIGMGE
jgi:Domain of unknown function (DUF4148)